MSHATTSSRAEVIFTEYRGAQQIWIRAGDFVSRSEDGSVANWQPDPLANSPMSGDAYYFPRETPQATTLFLPWWAQYEVPAAGIPANFTVPGTWYFWARTQQPLETDIGKYSFDSDWLIVNGHATDLTVSMPADDDWNAAAQLLQTGDDRILNDLQPAGAQRPEWRWISHTGTTLRAKTLTVIDDKLAFRIYPREAGNWNARIDWICWSNDPGFVPTDADLEIFCQTPTVFDAAPVSPASLRKPQHLVRLTITGQNVDQLDGVSLVQTPKRRSEYDPPIPPRPSGINFGPGYSADDAPFWLLNTPDIKARFASVGTIVERTSPNSIVAEFDLFNKQAGKYDLIGTRNGFCFRVAPVRHAFELQLPEGIDLLTNGDFESGSLDPWVAAPISQGVMENGEPMPGPEFAQTPWEGFLSYSGSFFAGTRSVKVLPSLDVWMTPNDGTIEQTVALPNGPGKYDLTLAFYTRLWDQRPVGCALTAAVVADEGLETESMSSVTVRFIDLNLMTVDGYDPYTPLLVDWSGTATRDVKVRFGFQTNTNAGWDNQRNRSIVAIDEVRLLLARSLCHTPFADADGDGDVDQNDFAVWQICMSGEGHPCPDTPEYCTCFDRGELPGDGDLDQTDLLVFERCASGPGIPADPNCAD